MTSVAGSGSGRADPKAVILCKGCFLFPLAGGQRHTVTPESLHSPPTPISDIVMQPVERNEVKLRTGPGSSRQLLSTVWGGLGA